MTYDLHGSATGVTAILFSLCTQTHQVILAADEEKYDPSAVTTNNGRLEITLSLEQYENLNFKSGKPFDGYDIVKAEY